MDAILPLVALFAFPLMMIWCMRSMSSHGESETSEESGSDVALKEELAELLEPVTTLRAQLALEKRWVAEER